MTVVLIGAGLVIIAIVGLAIFFSPRRVKDREFKRNMRVLGAACGRSQEAEMFRVLERHFGPAGQHDEVARQRAKRRWGNRGK